MIRIVEVFFKDHIRNVLPNERAPVPAFEKEASKAGVMAVKTYGWYRVTVQPKYQGQGYDVRDDICDQVYRPGTATPWTDNAIDQTWDWIMTQAGQLFEPQYDSGTRESLIPLHIDRMSQWRTQYWAEQGRD